MNNTTFVHNETDNQFELHIGLQIAFVEYYTEGTKIYLTHTETPAALQGRGIANALISQTLAHIKKQQQVLVPLCSFVSQYLDKHPQWHSILSEGYQM